MSYAFKHVTLSSVLLVGMDILLLRLWVRCDLNDLWPLQVMM